MEHERLVAKVATLPFVRNREMAASALAAVLGLIVDKLPTSDGRTLREELPEAFGDGRFDALRGQYEPAATTASASVDWIRRCFDLDGDEAHDLVFAVRDGVREAEPQRFEEIRARLPPDWGRLLEGT